VDNQQKESVQKKPKYEKNCTAEQRQRIEELTMILTPTWRLCHKWVKDNILTAHPDSIILALKTILEKETTGDLYAYANKIVSVQSGNLREKDFQQKEQNSNVDFSGLVENMKKLQDSVEK
jgi:hypothetical protein